MKPHGDAQSDLWYVNRLALELKKLYKDDPKAVCPDPIVKLNWNYGDDPDVHLVAKEINGYTVADKKQVAQLPGLERRRLHRLRLLDLLRVLTPARTRRTTRPRPGTRRTPPAWGSIPAGLLPGR